jgi:hypothetical protein
MSPAQSLSADVGEALRLTNLPVARPGASTETRPGSRPEITSDNDGYGRALAAKGVL